MSSSTTRARCSLTGAAATLEPRGRTTPAGSLRSPWSSCWVGAESGNVRPWPVSGQPCREASSSTVEGMFRSPTRDRARPYLDGAQLRGALLTAAGRGNRRCSTRSTGSRDTSRMP